MWRASLWEICSGGKEAWTLGERGQWLGWPRKQLHARLPRGQGKTRAPSLSVGLAVTMRKRNSLHKTEGDAEVILADIVIATIFLKGKLQKMKYDKIQ